MTLDDWRQQVDRLHRILGAQTYYWAVFDPSEPRDTEQEAICGDIADDLADIWGIENARDLCVEKSFLPFPYIVKVFKEGLEGYLSFLRNRLNLSPPVKGDGTAAGS